MKWPRHCTGNLAAARFISRSTPGAILINSDTIQVSAMLASTRRSSPIHFRLLWYNEVRRESRRRRAWNCSQYPGDYCRAGGILMRETRPRVTTNRLARRVESPSNISRIIWYRAKPKGGNCVLKKYAVTAFCLCTAAGAASALPCTWDV